MTKSKRDITLGEMQDECYKRLHICAPDVDGNNECEYFPVCKSIYRRGIEYSERERQEDYCPERWNLTDPPRFTDAQKEFLRGWMAIGAVEAHKCTITDEGDPFDVIDFYDCDASCIGTVARLDWLEEQIEFGVDMKLHDAVEDVPCAK